ncbi:MAG: ABC transporter ATP-binding protein [Pseudomonadota bacterium]
MVEIDALVKRFGPITAVDGVSFAVQRGEVLGFLGPNGAGKSTTMKMVTGFLTPDSGRVTVVGDDIGKRPVAAKSRIGYLPEGAPLYGDMTPAGFLDFIAAIRGFKGAERKRRIDSVIDRVNIGGVLNQPTETLSKGFKRRVGLAQAILHDPEVLILDEPNDGLDPNQKHEVRLLIQEMAAEKAIVLSTHILEEVDAVCTRAVIISQGKVLADGTPAELQAQADGHNQVHVGLRGVALEAARGALGALQGVDRVESTESEDEILLTVSAGDRGDLSGAIGGLAQSEGWLVTRLEVETGRLDSVFRDITRTEG